MDHKIEGGGTLKLCTRLIQTLDKLPENERGWEQLVEARIHMERLVYHPGEIVRGYFVHNPKPPKGGFRLKMNCFAYHIRGLPIDISESIGSVAREGLCVWAFQFLIPKKFPNAVW